MAIFVDALHSSILSFVLKITNNHFFSRLASLGTQNPSVQNKYGTQNIQGV